MPPAANNAVTVVTRVWLDEYAWLEALYNDVANSSPKLRYPDLISACVSLVFNRPGADLRIFTFLHTRLVLRDQHTARRQEEMWREQYELLLALQKSEQNRHPHPQFKLDHFTTACVALAMEEDGAKSKLFEHARRNIARRAATQSR
ncbi:hypothetical protein GM668_11670 [Duganella ginsengisoli]|uniref:Uncharacterized protein n=2 Tax=Pseudoduganella ginsengisoli TaxID=1462440 RepID=A0A6L6PZH2_9BURK|nr:hypothetical protein [Pseudoduganella ginsengisoli]